MSRSSAPATDRSIRCWAGFRLRAQTATHRSSHPAGTAPSRYRPADPLLAFLDGP